MNVLTGARSPQLHADIYKPRSIHFDLEDWAAFGLGVGAARLG